MRFCSTWPWPICCSESFACRSRCSASSCDNSCLALSCANLFRTCKVTPSSFHLVSFHFISSNRNHESTAVSVCVSSWTLVTMSVERYYAICQPFRSKSERQTWSHAYKMIGVLWAVSLIFMSPIAFLSELQPTRDPGPYRTSEFAKYYLLKRILCNIFLTFCLNPDKFKCRERWPSEHHLIVFTILLDVLLFLIPLIVMTGAYSRIILHLRGLVGLAHSHSLQHSVRRTNTGMAVSRESNGVQSARRESTHTMVSNAYNRTDTSLPPSCSSPPLPTSPSITTSHLQLASLSIDSEPNAKTVNNNHVNAIDLHKQNGDAGDSNSVEAGGAVRNHALLCERSSDESFGSMSLNQRSLHSILHHSNSPARTGPKKLHLVPPNESTALTGDAFSMPINENGSVYSDVSPNDGQHQRTQSKTSNHPLVHPNSHLTSSNQTRSVVQLRSSVDRHLAEKRQSHVLRMLVTVIVEFFVCWTPLHVINLLSLYYPQVVYQAIGYDGLSFLYWLAYLSTCTNPITYCFMNRRFRRSFRALFTCGRVRTDTSVSSRRSNHTAHASSSRL